MIAELFDSVGNRAMLVALTCNASCALVGCYLVLRRVSLMGDALSHAVLPGLVIAFVVSGSSGPIPMFLGALAAGIATTFLTQAVQRFGRLAPDASLGVVYTTLFAIGVLLVKRYFSEDRIHFDIACVYEGSLQQVALDTFDVGGAELPYAMLAAGPVLLVVVACLLLFCKELKISSFDPTLADTLGLAPGRMHYLLMLLVSLATVTSFEAIGSILVVAMLIAPAAAAQLLVNRLAPMLLTSVALSAVATVAGYRAAVLWNVSPSGAIAVTAGLLYLLAALFSPTEGALNRLLNNARLALRVRREDVLASLYRRGEAADAAPVTYTAARESAGGGLFAGLAISQLVRSGHVRRRGDELLLTDLGQSAAAELVRAHRLWESYLVDRVGIQTDHVHDAAHVMEHVLDEGIREQIANQLGVATDPHGKEIPRQ
ncbi:Manganese transport system membrane protein MntB [Posidoniimonas corsicana]|uniref:Manganese transport system membrane protein MntB n=1 Tax=Posidoniimonas corsicana TaxID=1938618 RepID=A0A5C5VAD2_9BACT|nr:iron chelate uptake ABC transporter family permease subunit [Posidoniimonas corsicana]TWT35518.1 Manganese transport system membrane protein MntB [Posidoniimonas corsicana]